LPAGRYLVSGSNYIDFGSPLYGQIKGKVLRGAGEGCVIVDNSSAVALISMGIDMSWTTPTRVPLAASVAKGDATVEVEDARRFRTGEMVYLDQDNDNNEFGTPVSGMPNGQVDRLQRQTVQITAISGGTLSMGFYSRTQRRSQ
jgi:hypothetical protein